MKHVFQGTLIIILIALAMFPCSVFAQTDRPLSLPYTPRPTQVVVIASQYFITDMMEGSTPAHLRSVLGTVHPNLLAVEAPANMADSWQYAPFDLQKVIKPWADDNGVPMVPVGHLDLEYNTNLDVMIKYFQTNGLLRDYQAVENRFRSLGNANKYTFSFINSERHDDIWRKYNSGLHRLYRQNTPAEEVNENIVANVIELCKANPGKRIAVVINAPHCYYLKDKLADQPGIILLNIDSALNFPQEKLKENTLPQDYLHALRILKSDNFSQIHPAVVSHLKTFLDRVHQYPQYEYDYLFFQGKMLLYRQESRMAASYFQNLTKVRAGILLKFDNETPVRDSAIVYVALAKLQMGQKKDAIARLRAISQIPDIHPKTKEWARQILSGLLPAEVTVDLNR